jgi:enterochelin esterase family protein
MFIHVLTPYFGLGTWTNAFEISDPANIFSDQKTGPFGNINQSFYKSKILNETRKCLVYTPVGYDQSAGTNYPVLYLLNDFGDDETAWLNQGKINNILDNAINEGSIKPLIVVMENTNSLKNSAGKDVADSVTITELMPYIEANYHTLNTVKMRAIAGCSSGGEIALQLAVNHKDIFSNLGIFSLPAEFNASKINFDKIKSANLNFFCLGAEKNDASYLEVVKLQSLLTKNSINYNWDLQEGSYNWLAWRKNLKNMLQLVFKN